MARRKAPVLVELTPEEIGGLVSVRWAGQPRWRWFLLNPIPPPLPPWRQALDGTETCAGCGRGNEDDTLRPDRDHKRLECADCWLLRTRPYAAVRERADA